MLTNLRSFLTFSLDWPHWNSDDCILSCLIINSERHINLNDQGDVIISSLICAKTYVRIPYVSLDTFFYVAFEEIKTKKKLLLLFLQTYWSKYYYCTLQKLTNKETLCEWRLTLTINNLILWNKLELKTIQIE